MIRSIFFLVFLGLCMHGPAALAQAIFKCSVGGNISYGDRPCADGKPLQFAPPAAGVAPPGADSVATQDARSLLALEKLRLKQQQDEARAQRERAKLAQATAGRRKTCDKLRLRRQWAQEDLERAATALGKTDVQERARIKLRRQAETLAVECPV